MIGLRDSTGHACTPRYEDGSKEGCKQEGSPGPGRLGLSGPQDLSWTEAGVSLPPVSSHVGSRDPQSTSSQRQEGGARDPSTSTSLFFYYKKVRGPCCVACMQNFSDQGWNPSPCTGSAES